MTKKSDECKAVQMSDQMVCKNCNLTWDMNDQEPPECKSIPTHKEYNGADREVLGYKCKHCFNIYESGVKHSCSSGDIIKLQAENKKLREALEKCQRAELYVDTDDIIDEALKEYNGEKE